MKNNYRVECPNCGFVYDVDFEGQDEYYLDCEECGYPIAIEVEYDNEGNNLIDFFVF